MLSVCTLVGHLDLWSRHRQMEGGENGCRDGCRDDKETGGQIHGQTEKY